MTAATVYEIGRCAENDADVDLRERRRCARRRRVLVPFVLFACGGLAACHHGMNVGKRGTGGNGSSGKGGQSGAGQGAGGAAGSGGSPNGAAGRGAAGATGSGGSPSGTTGGGPGGATGSGGVRSRTAGTASADAGAAGAGGIANPGDGGAAGSTASPEPVDNRPPRPDWKPPFTTPLGLPGWQQSTHPICDANQGVFSRGAFDVWADDRGIFAMVGDGCAPDLGVQCGGGEGASIKFNSGSGWQLLYQFPPGITESPRLWPSVTDGALLVTGTFDQYGVGMAFIDNGVSAFHATVDGYGAYGGFAVGPDLAYVIEASLLRYSGGAWSTVGDLGLADWLPLLAVWADPQGAIVTGYNQTIATQEGTGPMTTLSGVPAGEYRAVWAFGRNDVWFGNTAAQLLHYDGSKWQVHSTGANSMDGIRNLWGVSGTVYFTTSREFGRWNGSQVEILLEAASADLVGEATDFFGTIWGRSANEVFIAIRDSRYRNNACGSVFMLWFDGAQFHQF